jgi:hypothetical protein
LDRTDYLFIIGYEGNTAIVSGQAKRKYGKLTTAELLERGLVKAAFCSADFAADVTELELVRADMERRSGNPYSLEDLRRLFGVYGVPEGIKRVTVA